MGEDKEELLRYYRGTRQDLLATIDGLSDEALSEPSLDGWSVKDHLLHVATWDEIRAAEVARISAGQASAWRMRGEQDDSYNALSYDLRRELSVAQAKWELETTRQKLLDAIGAASDRGLDPSLYGEAGLRTGHEAEHTEWLRRWREEKGV